MTAATESFAEWLAHAQLRDDHLTPLQRGVLQGAFALRQGCGPDYYSTRLLSHFLLHAGTGLKVAQIARLVGISRPTASRQQGTSSKGYVTTPNQHMRCEKWFYTYDVFADRYLAVPGTPGTAR
jgi:hypothetical protein